MLFKSDLPFSITLYADPDAKLKYTQDETYYNDQENQYQITFAERFYTIFEKERNLSKFFSSRVTPGELYQIRTKNGKDEESFDLLIKVVYGFEDVFIPDEKLVQWFILYVELEIQNFQKLDANQQFLDALNRSLKMEEMVEIFNLAVINKLNAVTEMCEEKFQKYGTKILSEHSEKLPMIDEKTFLKLLQIAKTCRLKELENSGLVHKHLTSPELDILIAAYSSKKFPGDALKTAHKFRELCSYNDDSRAMLKKRLRTAHYLKEEKSVLAEVLHMGRKNNPLFEKIKEITQVSNEKICVLEETTVAVADGNNINIYHQDKETNAIKLAHRLVKCSENGKIVSMICIDKEKELLLTASDHVTFVRCKLWCVNTRKCIKTFNCEEKWSGWVGVSNELIEIVSLTKEIFGIVMKFEIKLINVNTGEVIVGLQQYGCTFFANVVFVKDGEIAVVTADSKVRFYVY